MGEAADGNFATGVKHFIFLARHLPAAIVIGIADRRFGPHIVPTDLRFGGILVAPSCFLFLSRATETSPHPPST